jgi:hypothetical protein
MGEVVRGNTQPQKHHAPAGRRVVGCFKPALAYFRGMMTRSETSIIGWSRLPRAKPSIKLPRASNDNGRGVLPLLYISETSIASRLSPSAGRVVPPAPTPRSVRRKRNDGRASGLLQGRPSRVRWSTVSGFP